MSIRHVTALALCVVCSAGFAQTTDLDAQARQQRMDSAYDHYQARTSSMHTNAGKKAHHHAARHHEATATSGTAPAENHASVGESLSSYGHSFVQDVKKAPHQLAEAGRETGHAIAGAAREQGHEAKAAVDNATK